MGDTLGGDYLFDIQYVQKVLCRAARRNGRRSLAIFDLLTHGPVSRAWRRFTNIDERIRHVIDETVIAAKDLVVFL